MNSNVTHEIVATIYGKSTPSFSIVKKWSTESIYVEERALFMVPVVDNLPVPPIRKLLPGFRS